MSVLPEPTLAALLGIRLAESSLEDVLQRIVEIAREALPTVDAASITLVRAERPFSAAYTGDLAHVADELQYDIGYGPCVDAALSGTTLLVTDMREELRWPEYAARVSEKGVLGSLSVPLPVQTDVVGGLNYYSKEPSDWPESPVAVEIAAFVAVAVSNAVSHEESTRFAADMQAAMASRAVIEQAKGVIMAQNRCDAESAFDILRQASMGRNVKLRDLATSLVEGISA